MAYRSVFRPGLFDGKVVVVTGAGSGIGRCTAHELAALGASVVLIGRNAAKLQTVAAEIAQDDGCADAMVCDVRQEEAVQQCVAAVVAQHGRIDGLVNNAGGQYITPLEAISAKGWQAVIDTNLTGGFLMARACYLQSMQHHGGAIVNIVADMWGSMPGMAHSGAARAGMVSLTETAAVEWARSGVRVNAVAPGYIASSGMDHYPPEYGPHLRGMAATVPLGRFGNEAETAAGIVFLLSPAAAFISGSTLRIDGARPQVRMGWPQRQIDAQAMAREAVRPFDGFHRAQLPRLLALAPQSSGSLPTAAAATATAAASSPFSRSDPSTTPAPAASRPPSTTP